MVQCDRPGICDATESSRNYTFCSFYFRSGEMLTPQPLNSFDQPLPGHAAWSSKNTATALRNLRGDGLAQSRRRTLHHCCIVLVQSLDHECQPRFLVQAPVMPVMPD